MSSDLVEALHVIENFSGDECFDDMLDLATQHGLPVRSDETAPDLATQLYLHDPQILERKERERLFDKRKVFESYPSSKLELVTSIADLPTDLTLLEHELDEYFESKKRGLGCRIIRKDTDGEVRFLVQHGQVCKREPSRKGRQSTGTFFRPERTDLVFLDLVHNELWINAQQLGDIRAYRLLFCRHLFGDENRFVFAPKYTLDPLKTQGQAALCCSDVDGIEAVRLCEIEYTWGGAFDHFETHRADDVFRALTLLSRDVERDPYIRRAVFRIKLRGEKKARTVAINAGNKSGYNRGEEAMIIDHWLRARGFVITRDPALDAQIESVMASA